MVDLNKVKSNFVEKNGKFLGMPTSILVAQGMIFVGVAIGSGIDAAFVVSGFILLTVGGLVKIFE